MVLHPGFFRMKRTHVLLKKECMMSDLLKKKHSDEYNARKFVRLVFDHGRITCQSIQKAIAMTTSGDVSFPTTGDNSLEISRSILGTSIAIPEWYSKVMSRERGIQIESLDGIACRPSYRVLGKMQIERIRSMNKSLRRYASNRYTT